MKASLDLPPELLEAIAERAAELVVERIESDNGDGWLRGADAIADYIGAKRDRVYALSSTGRIPVEHEGSALIARKSVLDAWMRAGGGKRP